MRKLLISILLAGVATSPAFAQDRRSRPRARAERAAKPARNASSSAKSASRPREQRAGAARRSARPSVPSRASSQRAAAAHGRARACAQFEPASRVGRPGRPRTRRERASGSVSLDLRRRAAARRDGALRARSAAARRTDVASDATVHRGRDRWSAARRPATAATAPVRSVVPTCSATRVPIVSNTPREGTQPPRCARRRAGAIARNWRPDWRSDVATTGGTGATGTGRCSTSASITIRSAGTIGPTRSAGGCGRAITAAATGSTTRGSIACLMHRPAIAGSATMTTRSWSTRGTGEVVDVIYNFFW